MQTCTNKYPFLGLNAYSEKEKSFFLGRDQEIKKILQLIERHVVSVLFGKSGLGKTSILNAGIVPELKKKFFYPIYLTCSFDEKSEFSIENLKRNIFLQIKKLDKNALPFNDLTFWEYFHQLNMMDGFVKPVLIFDQFEEFFIKTKNNNQVKTKEFITEIADLLENQIPLSVQKKYENLDIPYDIQEQNFKVIISLRESYLPIIESWSNRMPSLKKSRFRLLKMYWENALKTINFPNVNIIEKGKDEEILDIIFSQIYHQKIFNVKNTNFLKKWKNHKIEPFLLSLVFFELNEIRIQNNENQITVAIAKKVKVKNIIKNFYLKNIKNLDENSKLIIEDELLTVDGYRKLQHKEDLIKEYKINPSNIETLINCKILREISWNNAEHLEIIHDILLPVIVDNRDKRLEKERIREQKAELILIQRQEENKRIKLAKKHRQRMQFIRNISAIVFVAFIISCGFAYYAFEQEKIAESNLISARALLITKKNPTLSFQLARQAYEKSDNNNMSEIALRLAFFEGEFYKINDNFNTIINQIEVCNNGENILTLSNYEIQLRNKDGIILNTFKDKDKIIAMKLAHQENLILTIHDNNFLKLRNYKNEILQVFETHKEEITDCCFSFDNQYIASCSKDNTAKVFDKKGNLIIDFKEHSNDILSIDFAKDTLLILTAGKDRKAKIWNLKGQLINDLEHHSIVKKAIFFNENIVTIDYSNFLNFWTKSGKKIFSKQVHNKTITNLKSFKDSLILLTSEDNSISIWNKKGEKLNILKGHSASILDACFTNDGKSIISCSQDNSVMVWRNDKKESHIFKRFEDDILSADCTNDGDLFLNSLNNIVYVWDKNASKITELIGHKSLILTSVFSHQSKLILTSSEDKTVKLWNINGDLLQTFSHRYKVYSANFSNNDKNIVTTSLDGVVRIFDLKGVLLLEFSNHKDMVYSANFSPDDKLLVSAGADKTARIFDRKGNEKLILEAHKDLIYFVNFSPKGDKIITTSWDNTAKLWNLEGKLLSTFIGHQGVVNYACFSEDETKIITSSQDGKIKLWDINGNELFEYQGHKGEVYFAKFTKNEDEIFSISQDKTLHLFPISIKKILSLNE